MTAVSRPPESQRRGSGGAELSVPLKFLISGGVIILMTFAIDQYCSHIPSYTIAFFTTLSGFVSAISFKKPHSQ